MLADNHMYKDRRGPKRNRLLQESTENEDDGQLTARNKFRVDTFTVISDSLNAELERRKQIYLYYVLMDICLQLLLVFQLRRNIQNESRLNNYLVNHLSKKERHS